MKQYTDDAVKEYARERRIKEANASIRGLVEFAQSFPDLWEYVKTTQPEMIQRLRELSKATPLGLKGPEA